MHFKWLQAVKTVDVDIYFKRRINLTSHSSVVGSITVTIFFKFNGTNYLF